MDQPIIFKSFGQNTAAPNASLAMDDSRPSSSRIMTSGSQSGAMDNVTSGQIKIVAEKPFLVKKTLDQMGYNSNEVEDWEQIEQPPKKNLYEELRYMFNNQIKPDVQIWVGSFSTEIVIKLPDEKVTESAFRKIYQWMLAEQPQIQREGILELFIAGTFLRISSLLNECWQYIENDVRFREDTAFMLYKEARLYQLEDIMELMLTRISKFFLTLVASKDFLELNVDEVCSLLSSNMVGVNSEIEIFLSMVRWLNDNWEERGQYLLRLIKCVRFTMLPFLFLITLKKPTKSVEINRITENETVRKMITDGISYASAQLIYGDTREEFIDLLERYDLTEPIQRQWIYDKECFYHHRVDCGNMHHVTYKSFLQYLDMIQSMGKQYWDTLSYARGNEPCSGCLCMARSVSTVVISTDEKLVTK